MENLLVLSNLGATSETRSNDCENDVGRPYPIYTRERHVNKLPAKFKNSKFIYKTHEKRADAKVSASIISSNYLKFVIESFLNLNFCFFCFFKFVYLSAINIFYGSFPKKEVNKVTLGKGADKVRSWKLTKVVIYVWDIF